MIRGLWPGLRSRVPQKTETVMRLVQHIRQLLAGSAVETVLRRLGLGRPLLAWHERRVLPRGRVRVHAYGFQLEFLARSRTELTRVEMVGRDEREFIERFLACLRPGDCIYDVGANVGVISVLTAQRLNDLGGGTVLAIEANPLIAETTSRNLTLNWTPGVRTQVVATALGNASGEGHLLNAGDGAEGKDRLIPAALHAGPMIPVPIRTGDELAVDTGLAPDVIKVDVEGAELQVMQGFAGLLAAGRLRAIFIEVHPALMATHGDCEQDLRSWMARFGYISNWCKPRGCEVHHQFVRTN